jgi:hypothetical protein
MSKILDDNYMVCGDCLPVIANGDYSHLDYYYDVHGNELALDIRARIEQGFRNAGGSIYVGDETQDEQFSHQPCDCCGTPKFGARYHCIVLTT